jgi:hypothetical protein
MGTTTLIDRRGAGGSAPTPPDGEEPVVLYVKRKQIYPKLVFGPFRNLKWFLLVVTLAIYYVLPWIRWPRGAGVPDQAVLADFAAGKFYFFWLEIWPQEVFYITGLLIGSGADISVRKRCGPTCSLWSSGSSRAIATHA